MNIHKAHCLPKANLANGVRFILILGLLTLGRSVFSQPVIEARPRARKTCRRPVLSNPRLLNSSEDESWLTRFQLQDPNALNDLVLTYQRELSRYLERYLQQNIHLAEDVLQEVWMKVLLKAGTYDGRPMRPWLYAIATRTAVDHLRKQGRHPTVSLFQTSSDGSSEDTEAGELIDLLVSDEAGPLAALSTKEREEWVRREIDRLSPALKEALLLAYYEDLKYLEIGVILGVPTGTVKSRLHAALEKLQGAARARHIP